MSLVRFPSPGFDKHRFVDSLSRAGLDALLITSPENTYYVTGYPAIPSAGNPILFALRNVLPFFALLDRQGCATLLCWGGAAAGIEYDAAQVVPFPDVTAAYDRLMEVLREKQAGITTLGIESSCPYAVFQVAGQVVGARAMRVADEVLQSVRLIKSPQEIAYLQQSTAIVEKTVSELMDLVKPGIRRPTLIHEAKTRMLSHGATGIGHVTLSFGSSNPEVEIDEALELNKLVVLDLGALYLGYASDNRRLMYTGKIPAGMLDLHKRMCAIVDEIASRFVPGKTFHEIYELAIGLYAQHHLDPFIPNVGHTIGLNTEEDWIYKNSPVVIEPGMVVNLELYSLYPTGELIGDEETYVVAAAGADRLTTLPRDIREI